MIGIPEASAAISGIKTAIEMLKGVQSLKSETEINQAVIAIQRTLLEAQLSALQDRERHSDLLSKITQLESIIAVHDRWTEQKARYRLTEFPTGRFAYVLLPDFADDEPPHKLCVKCFQEDRKSILQVSNKHSGGESVYCQYCKEDITLKDFSYSEPISIGRRTSWIDPY
ncbi:MAG: hypothetical protein V4472_11690 [Pseudomonadota bacterium]